MRGKQSGRYTVELEEDERASIVLIVPILITIAIRIEPHVVSITIIVSSRRP